MTNSLAGKRIVIIGGTSGMGLATAEALIQEGACVVAVGLDEESSRKARQLLGEQAVVIAGDAVSEGIAEAAIDSCIHTFGGFDGLLHVAGGSGRKFGDGPLHELSLEGWKKTFDLNLTSLMLSNRAAVRKWMELDSGGSIVNITSVLGYSPSPTYFSTHAYAAAKSAVSGFTKSAASYYARYHIRVNAVAPGLVETPMSQRAAGDEKIMSFIKMKQPLDGGRIGRPSDLVGAILFCLSDASSFMTGQVLAVDGGWSVSEGQLNGISPR